MITFTVTVHSPAKGVMRVNLHQPPSDANDVEKSCADLLKTAIKDIVAALMGECGNGIILEKDIPHPKNRKKR